MVIGLSVFSRSVTHGTPSAVVSSCKPPLSVITKEASFQRNKDSFKKEVTGAKKGDKARLCWCESERTSKKRYIFGGRGVFSLDPPFNG